MRLFHHNRNYIKVDSHDPIFGANYYSNSKKLVMRIKISMSSDNARKIIGSKKWIVRMDPRVFPSGGGDWGDPPMSSMSPPSLLILTKFFFDIFSIFAMTKANLTSITSLKMQTLLSYWNIKATTIEITKVGSMRLQLHDAIYRPDFFVLMLRYCATLKAIRYKSASFNRIVADKLHHVISA